MKMCMVHNQFVPMSPFILVLSNTCCTVLQSIAINENIRTKWVKQTFGILQINIKNSIKCYVDGVIGVAIHN